MLTTSSSSAVASASPSWRVSDESSLEASSSSASTSAAERESRRSTSSITGAGRVVGASSARTKYSKPRGVGTRPEEALERSTSPRSSSSASAARTLADDRRMVTCPASDSEPTGRALAPCRRSSSANTRRWRSLRSGSSRFR